MHLFNNGAVKHLCLFVVSIQARGHGSFPLRSTAVTGCKHQRGVLPGASLPAATRQGPGETQHKALACSSTSQEERRFLGSRLLSAVLAHAEESPGLHLSEASCVDLPEHQDCADYGKVIPAGAEEVTAPLPLHLLRQEGSHKLPDELLTDASSKAE